MTTPPFEFEKALKELENITSWFESSDVDLDAGLVKFERGMELAHQLKTHLTSVENRVEKIKQRFSASSAGAAPATSPAELPEASEADLDDQANLFRA
jgi:exodeoxyribonuclease VII small subunit